jgi:hypothetical protein
MTDLAEMWANLEAYQPTADRRGYGAEWRRMCTERTEEAAMEAAWAAELAATSSQWAAAWAEALSRRINRAEEPKP